MIITLSLLYESTNKTPGTQANEFSLNLYPPLNTGYYLSQQSMLND